MERFNYIHKTNLFFYSITLILFISIFLFFIGLMAQIVLGTVQVVLALILLLNWNKLDTKSCLMLNIYLLSLIVYGFVVFLYTGFTPLMLFIAMGMATYFLFVTYQIKQIQYTKLKV